MAEVEALYRRGRMTSFDVLAHLPYGKPYDLVVPQTEGTAAAADARDARAFVRSVDKAMAATLAPPAPPPAPKTPKSAATPGGPRLVLAHDAAGKTPPVAQVWREHREGQAARPAGVAAAAATRPPKPPPSPVTSSIRSPAAIAREAAARRAAAPPPKPPSANLRIDADAAVQAGSPAGLSSTASSVASLESVPLPQRFFEDHDPDPAAKGVVGAAVYAAAQEHRPDSHWRQT